MNSKILKWFKSPYPLLYGERRDYFQIIITSIFISALVYVIRPFGLANLPSQALILFIANVTSGAMFTSILVTQILPKYCFNEDQWQIWKQAALILFNFSAVALVLHYLVLRNIGALTFLSYLGVTILIASGPLFMRLLITQNRLLKVNLEQARLVNEILKPSGPVNPNEAEPHKNQIRETVLELKAHDGETFQLSEGDFIYAKAEKNYVEIFWYDTDKVKTTVLRMAFSSLIKQMSDSELPLIHCHRSYLVNQQSISKIIGNSRGYSMVLSVGDHVIPVSRAKAKQVLLEVKV